MAVNFGYIKSDIEINEVHNNTQKINSDIRNTEGHTYEEAINLTGHGKYSIGLLASTCMTLFSMSIDMFGFTVVVAGSACEFQLNFEQKKILLSMPFIGAMATSYTWGYISDTQGRRKSLLIAMWGSYLASTIGAFSPHWIMMGLFKFISVSFCSCAQSATYAMIGESCPETVKGPYMVILSSVLNLGLPCQMVMGYISTKIDFSYDLGFISFTPWRLLALIQTLPLGISAISLHFFYESPKFLANIGQESRALDNLRKIWERNHGGQEKYPVKNLILQEQGIIKGTKKSLLKSMWEQTVPLFKTPYLLQTFKLYYLTAVVYGVTNSLYTWFPYLSNAFNGEASSSGKENDVQGLCYMIASTQNANSTADGFSCEQRINVASVLTSLIHGVVFIIINISLCKLAHKRKAILITIFTITNICIFGIANVTDNIGSLILYVSACLPIFGVGIISSYLVELYPTSYRGMAACLAVLVARSAGLVTTYLVGTFVVSYCANTFYTVGALIISGIAVACFLPPDKQLKS